MVSSGPRRRRKTRTGTSTSAGQLIVDRRLVIGLTQADLADLAGVGISSVQSLEAGKTTVSLDIAIRVSDALGLVIALGPSADLRTTDGVAVLGRAGERR